MTSHLARFLCTTSLLLVLSASGCMRTDQQAQEKADAEYAAASAPASGDDPLQQHLRARAQVNPRNMGAAAYTKHVPSDGSAPDDAQLAQIEHEVLDMNREAVQIAAVIPPATPAHKPPPPPDLIIDGKRVITHVPPQAQTQTYTPVSTGGQTAPLSGHAAVQDVRLGVHPDKTRIVLDLDARSGFQYDLDNAQRALRITLPGTAWNAEQQKILSNNDLIAGYAAQPAADGGTTLVIALKRNVKLLLSAYYPPDQGKGDRFVFDIGPT
jgi:hypothetical protein